MNEYVSDDIMNFAFNHILFLLYYAKYTEESYALAIYLLQ